MNISEYASLLYRINQTLKREIPTDKDTDKDYLSNT